MTVVLSEGILPFSKLVELGREQHDDYVSAQPFPHAVIDGLFGEQLLETVLSEFEQQMSEWKEFDTKYEKKFQQNSDELLGLQTRTLIHALNSSPFLNFLQDLTGIKGLIPDPYLVGGGLHQIPQGGKLGVHVDFNRHKTMRVFRRVNVILYLNKDWDDSYGGHFQLWNETQSECVTKILPVFNRMAIFSTTNTSFHGHPEPLTCPPDRYRRSLALYYYTAEESGDQLKGSHSTIFLDGNGRREELGKRSKLGRLKHKLRRVLGS